MFLCQGAGRAEGGDLGHGLGAGPATLLLTAAHEEGLEAQTGADIERADALGGVELVAADADEIGPQTFGREGDLAEGLHRVGVQKGGGARLLQETGDGGNVGHGAGFVIDQHQRNEYSIGEKRLPHGFDGDGPGGIRLQPRDGIAPGLQLIQGFADGVVLHGGTEDVPALALHGLGTLEKGPVVALRAAGGEDQLLALAAQQRGHLRPALIQQLFGLPPLGVGGAGVAVALGHGPQGRLRRLRADPGGGGIVQIMFHFDRFPFDFRKTVILCAIL